jgi:hypothetical protein
MRPTAAMLATVLIATLGLCSEAPAGEKAPAAKANSKPGKKTLPVARRPAPTKAPDWTAHFEKALARKINVNFKGVPAEKALRFACSLVDVSITIEESAKAALKKKVTLKAEKIAVSKVLEDILKIVSLERRYEKHQLLIAARKKPKPATKDPARPDSPRRKAPPAKSLEFLETPAIQVVNYVAQKSKLNVVIDPKATKLLETRISFKATGMKLRQVLDWALRLSGTEKRMIDGVILIRPRQQAPKIDVKKAVRKASRKPPEFKPPPDLKLPAAK